jgi:1-phosphatidylinositol-3-phosphate 5-kinase
MRAGYLDDDENAGYIRSLSMSSSWSTQGGKSKAKFFKTADDRFVVKIISSVELHMFLEFAPAYFGIIVSFIVITCLYYIRGNIRIHGKSLFYTHAFDFVQSPWSL